MEKEMTDLDIYELLKKGCFNFTFNLNDTFHWATGDATEIDTSDFEDLIPIIKKHGFMAIIAYEALKRGYDPDDEMDIKGIEFDATKLEIIALMESNKLLDLIDRIKVRSEELSLFGEEIRYQSDSVGIFRDKDYKHKICAVTAYLPTQGIGVSAKNAYLAKKKLIKVYSLLKED